jgi:hypothetical protein
MRNARILVLALVALLLATSLAVTTAQEDMTPTCD